MCGLAIGDDSLARQHKTHVALFGAMTEFVPAADYQRRLAEVVMISQTAVGRYQYAQMLKHVADLLEQGKMPAQRDIPPDSLLRCIHVALASELFKSTELLGALCKFGVEDPTNQFTRILNVKQEEVYDFFGKLATTPTNEQVRDWLPMLHTVRLPGLTPDEEAALALNDKAVCDMIRDAVLLAKEAHAFLGKFRNRFNHTYGLVLVGGPLPDGDLAVFNLAGQPHEKPDGKLAMFDGLLLASSKNNAILLDMLGVLMEAEDFILRFRGSAFVHGTPTIIAKLHVRKDAGVKIENVIESYGSAFRKLGFKDVKATINQEFEATRAHLEAADRFYGAFARSSFASAATAANH